MKRTKRNKLSKDKSLNLMEPIPFDKLGGVDDPCFGKYPDPNNQECSMCGDSEICTIVFSQKAHLTRDKIEKEKDFKDIQNLNPTWKDLSQYFSKSLKKGDSTIASIRALTCKEMGISEMALDKLIKVLAIKSKKFKVDTKNTKITKL